jgi:hypothetical protein
MRPSEAPLPAPQHRHQHQRQELYHFWWENPRVLYRMLSWPDFLASSNLTPSYPMKASWAPVLNHDIRYR